ncbi:MAG: TIGR00282 family metallophosphoesterase [candidate division FCPU426 bacterium]
MNLLLIGDVIGGPGRLAVAKFLPELKASRRVEMVMANVENLAAGFGVSDGTLGELVAAGVDVFSSGNHIWDKKEVGGLWEKFPTLLRPANYPEGTPGRSEVVFNTASGVTVGVANVLGRVFFANPIDDPFPAVKKSLAALKAKGARVTVVDFHAEATSEKIAMNRHLDGEASVVVGTHTHVPTADGRVSAKGTATLTDLGLTGAYGGIIGMKTESVLPKFLTGRPVRFEVSEEEVEFWALLVEVDERSGKAVSVEQIRRKL